MVNLKYLNSAGIEIEYIDLSDNKLANLKELKLLEHMSFLSSISFHKSDDETNPFCTNFEVYWSEVSLLKLRKGCKIDGRTQQEMINIPGESIKKNLIKRNSEKNEGFQIEERENTIIQKQKVVLNHQNYIPEKEPMPEDNENLHEMQNVSRRIEDMFSKTNNFKELRKDDIEKQNQPQEKERKPTQKKMFDSKINVDALEKKISELQDVITFKEQSFAQRESELKHMIDFFKDSANEWNSKTAILTKKNDLLEHEKNQLACLVEESKKRLGKDQNLLEKYQQSQNECFKVQTKLEAAVQSQTILQESLKTVNDKLMKSEFTVENMRSQIENYVDQLRSKDDKVKKIETDFMEKLTKSEQKIEDITEKMNQISLENIHLKGSENNIKISANINWENEKMELRKQHSLEMAALQEKYSSLENNLQKEKINLEVVFHDNINKMEGEFKTIIIELSEKNSDLRKDNQNLKQQTVVLIDRTYHFFEAFTR